VEDDVPGPASHLIIIEEETKRVLADPNTFSGPVLDALNHHRREAALGSIGPDMIFWADWAEFTPIVNVIFDIYKTLDEIYEALMAIWQPLIDHITKVLDSLTGGLVSELQETIAIVEGIIETAMLRLITEQVPILDFLKPHFQIHGSSSDTKDWNWLDYTHHRWTGEFNTELIRRAHASGRPELRAYAYGWLSHVTADVVGHAYVNTAVGGPYRSHWIRHFIQEKFMDTWVWGFYKSGTSMPSSVTPGTPPFAYATWPNVNGSSLHELIDLGNELPAPLRDLITDSLRATYNSRPHPTVKGTIPFLDGSHINRAYQMLVEGLEIMTSKDRAIPRPEAPSVLNDDAPPTFPTPGGGSGGDGDGGGGSFSLLALLLAILEFIKDLFEYIHDLVLWLVSQVTTPLTYPVRYALYLLQLSLYEIYRAFRWALALTGFAYPDPDQLFHPLAQQFVNPFGAVQAMPRRENPVEMDRALMFPGDCATPQPQPTVCLEPAAATSGPYTRWPRNYPFWFIEGEPLNPVIVEALTAATTPQQTIQIAKNLFPNPPSITAGGPAYSGSLGNALDLYHRYAARIAQDGGGANGLNLPDWNLDADRGYGFKCWSLLGGAQALEPPAATGVAVTYAVPT
jgi:hypothetical protein